MTEREARIESSRCLYCHDAPCITACPTGIDIPSFIELIDSGAPLAAARVILEANVLGASCARVCAVEQLCEGACVLAPGDGPIAIGRLQRHATDTVLGRSDGFAAAGITAASASNGAHVAVVGAGPAGLAAAARLRQLGAAVTVYERRARAGGLLTYGIIPLREPLAVAAWEVDQVESLGVTLRTSCTVGVDITVDELVARHDAVLLATGAGSRVGGLQLDGAAGAAGVEDALAFIEAVRTARLTPPEQSGPAPVRVGSDVVIIGAGNTAMDAALIAARLGARTVTCVYRRTRDEMTGYPAEYAHCVSEGVQFRWLTQPVAVVTDPGGATRALDCRVVELGAPGADGRPSPVVTQEQVLLPCDHVLVATGQAREPELLTAFGLERADDGRPLLGPDGASTSRPRVFACGDAVLAGAELSVVDAVRTGRDAANTIDTQLRARATA